MKTVLLLLLSNSFLTFSKGTEKQFLMTSQDIDLLSLLSRLSYFFQNISPSVPSQSSEDEERSGKSIQDSPRELIETNLKTNGDPGTGGDKAPKLASQENGAQINAFIQEYPDLDFNQPNNEKLSKSLIQGASVELTETYLEVNGDPGPGGDKTHNFAELVETSGDPGTGGDRTQRFFQE